MTNQTLAFRDPSRFTKLLKFFLQGCLVFTTIRIVYDYTAFTFFNEVVNGVYPDLKLLETLREATDNRHILIESLYSWVLMGTGLSFAFWMYQANQNCRALGAKNMKFSPAWCIGWFFVPICCLWKPYEALKEIWNASYDSKHWASVQSFGVMKFWWICYLISGVFQVLLHLRLFAPTESYPLLANMAQIAIMRDLLSYPLCISAIRMVNDIYGRQMLNIELQRSLAFPRK
jgi:uncharacterized membrane protein